MPHQTARIIRVFVSSPRDVADERDVLSKAIDSINRTDGQAGDFRLELFRWEDAVVPQVGPKPQQVVDGQTTAYDIYLGIMSTRFGTPTGRCGSGTEKEYKDALKNWKAAGTPWITFYFDDAPTLSSRPDDVKQYLKVCEFREKMEKQGLYATYKGVRGSEDSFYDKVSQHLRKIARLLLSPLVDSEPSETSSEHADITPPPDYCQQLQNDCQDVGLLGLQDKKGRAVCLNHVYVPLATPRQHDDPDTDRDHEDMARRMGREEEKPQLLLERLDRESLYVSGPAGSGKSTFCRWVTWLACQGRIPEHPVAAPDGFTEEFPESFRNRLPLLVRLRDFWKYLPDAPGGRTLSRTDLEKSLERWLNGTMPGGLTWPCAADHLRRGALLLILDGLDEVPVSVGEEGREYHPRAMLLSGLIDAAASWVKSGNRLLVTSRPYGVTGDEEKKLALVATPIADLSGPLGELLVRRWFHILAHDRKSGRRKAEEMLAHVSERPELEPLTFNPMLMTAMCVILGAGGRLPQDKHELYDRMFDNVLHNRYEKDPQQIAIVRNRLSVIAHGMHTGDGLDEDRTTPQAEVTYDETERLLQLYRDQSPATEPGYQGAVAAREDLLTNSGLFLPKGGKRAGFYHFTFQDFSAAQILWEREADLAAYFRRRGAVPDWRSTLSFVFGALLDKSTLPDRGIRLLETLIKEMSLDDLALSVVISDCLQILAGRGFGLQPESTEKFVQLCLDAIEREVSLPERFELGLALGRLGDPRVVTDLRDHGDRQAWVEIPPGDYVFGDGNEPMRIDKPYLLSRYPVTNCQYKLFFDEGGYENESVWSEAGRKWREAESVTAPEYWRHGKWNGPNQPVVGVSWWEAEAFAAWIGGFLPTERQWEAAARGTKGREYPWEGKWEDGICNSVEAGLGGTSAVGIFPRDQAGKDGVMDLAGNVWEWCQDVEASFRVFRGGSWGFDAGFCRGADRGRNVPGYRYSFLGFRVAAVPQVAQVQHAEPGT